MEKSTSRSDSSDSAENRDDGMIVRQVKVHRTRSPQETLDATGRKQYLGRSVMQINKIMPRGEGDEVEVVFFKLRCSLTTRFLIREYESQDLEPVDPISLAQVNIDDQAFADKHPNGTLWKDSFGRWHYLTFKLLCGERRLDVYGGNDVAYNYGWWFAGIRKK